MRVLIADDDHISRRKLEKFLESMDYDVLSCKDGLEAWETIQSENAPNLLVLDWMMPGMDGLEICRQVRKLDKEPYTFILLLTSKNETNDIVTGMEAGADGYITKPFNQNELSVRLMAGRRIVKLNEELLGIRNILQKETIHDELTGLYNRRYMAEIVEKEFAGALRYKTDLSCLLIDLDFFKDVNDTFGHLFGDLVLREFSVCLKRMARRTDIPIRCGGEEFMMLLTNTDIEGARAVAENIRSACEALKFDDGNNSTTVTVSIGAASLRDHKLFESSELITLADKALYHSKAEGRNRVSVYTRVPSVQSAESKIREEKDLRHLKENLSSVVEKTKKSAMESLHQLACKIGSNGHKQRNHSAKQYIYLIGKRLALPPSVIDTFKNSAMLHDTLKILLKKTLKADNKELNREKKTAIEDHPYHLSELIELFNFFDNEKSILLYHHENFDGTGCPDGLKENEIPLGARIFTIANTIAGMLTEQPRRKKFSSDEIVQELADRAGKQFDPNLVSLFIEIIEKQNLLSV